MPARRPRITQQETEQRMLGVAVAQVSASGLTVSLDHLSFEALIAAADVSRAAAYRRWPNKELFLRDLLLELAQAAMPRAVVLGDRSWAPIRDLLLAEPSRLSDPGYRRRLVADLFRVTADIDFQAMHASPEWRTYLALHATYASLTDATLRADVQHALAATQHRFVSGMAANWERLAGLLGFRLRSDGLAFSALAELVSAGVRGLLVMAMADPAVTKRYVEADPFDTGSAQWSLAAVSCAAIALAFLEPEPELAWDEASTAALREGLAELPIE